MGEFAIGQGVPRFEDPRLVRGGGRYTDDVQLPGMAYGIVVRSPHGHAKINVARRRGGESRRPACSPSSPAPTGKPPGLATCPRIPDSSAATARRCTSRATRCWPKTMSAGSATPSLFVVAETIAQALDASELIEADYEELPIVVTTEDAVKPDAPRVFEDCPGNIAFTEFIGDKAACEAGIAKAAHVVKHRFVINRVTAVTMEPRGAVAHYTPGDRRFAIYTATQRPHGYRAEMAGVLKVPESDIRIVTGDTGGSFGMKTPVFNEIPLCCYASKLTGRPVKWISTRTESFLSDAQARDNVTEAELALDKDGHFLALRVTNYAAIGAYLQPNMPAYFLNAGTLAGTYRTPAIFVDTSGVYSNTNPVRPYRGNGRPESAFIIERMVELAAKELGIDSTELRRRNYIAPQEMPFKTGLTFTYDCGEFEKNMDLAMGMADFKGFEKRKKESRKNGKLRGIGLSNTIERAAAPGTEGAEVRFDKSGTVTLMVGSNNQGQGHETVFKQIVGRQARPASQRYSLSVRRHRPGVLRRRHWRLALGNHGRLSLAACHRKGDRKGRRDCRLCAQGCARRDQICRRRVLVAQDQSDQDHQGNRRRRPASRENSADMEPGLSANAVHKTPVNNYPNGCHICEIEIDLETGVAEVVRYTVVDDVGTVLNPMLLHGQIHGGVVQGVGQVLMENIHFDESGQLVTASFMDYAMPRAHDICPMKVESNAVPTKTNPLGTKGAGEAGCVGALPAVTNAVVDALKDYGVKHVEMPATPERLWRIIHAAG